MDKLDKAIITLKAESKRLEQELKQVRNVIAALQGAGRNSRGMTSSRSGRTISTAARQRIAAAQKARWAKWRAERAKKSA